MKRATIGLYRAATSDAEAAVDRWLAEHPEAGPAGRRMLEDEVAATKAALAEAFGMPVGVDRSAPAVPVEPIRSESSSEPGPLSPEWLLVGSLPTTVSTRIRAETPHVARMLARMLEVGEWEAPRPAGAVNVTHVYPVGSPSPALTVITSGTHVVGDEAAELRRQIAELADENARLRAELDAARGAR